MAAITVGVVPVSVREALGRDDSTKSIIWEGTAQNVSPAVTVYRLRSVDAPTPGDAGFRHPSGERWTMTVWSDDLGATWLWAAEGSAVVVLETGIPGT